MCLPIMERYEGAISLLLAKYEAYQNSSCLWSFIHVYVKSAVFGAAAAAV